MIAFDSAVTQYIADTQAYEKEVRGSLMGKLEVALAAITMLRRTSTHPYELLKRRGFTPLQRDAVLQGVQLRAEIDNIEARVARELPHMVPAEREIGEGLLARYANLQYENAARQFFNDQT